MFMFQILSDEEQDNASNQKEKFQGVSCSPSSPVITSTSSRANADVDNTLGSTFEQLKLSKNTTADTNVSYKQKVSIYS